MDQLTKLVSRRLKTQAVPGPHPGSEVLAAFAENALPEGERGQLLQHLGGCADCREIVFLALPESAEAQRVLIVKPRPVKRWVLGWAALAVSLAVAAIFLTTDRLQHKSHNAPTLARATAPATENAPVAETQIAANKSSPELDQLQTARATRETKPPASSGRDEVRPQLQAKRMTAKLRPGLEFDQSGEVHLRAEEKSANALAGFDNKFAGKKDDKQKEDSVNGLVARGAAAAKAGYFGNAGAGASAPGADQGARKYTDADTVSEANSLPIEARNAPSPAPPGLAKESSRANSLSGTIVDPSGAVIANARVTMTGPSGAKTATSDPQGKFSFDRLTPGSYSIKAEASGFKATEVQQVAVLDNKTSAVRLSLDPGSASETVEVSAAAPIVNNSATTPDAASVRNSVIAQSQEASSQLTVQEPVSKSRRRAEGSAFGAMPRPRWTLSSEGFLQRSVDSGRTWQVVSVVTGATFRAVSAVGANIWVGGNAGALYHSLDSGQTWSKIQPSVEGKKLDHDIIRVDFSDALRGAVTTANGEVWTTSDGGEHWQREVAH